MNENEDEIIEDADIIELINDEGQVEKFELIEKLAVEDDEYAALLPLEGEEEVLLFKYMYDENEELILTNIEDKDEFTNVAAVYEAMMDDII